MTLEQKALADAVAKKLGIEAGPDCDTNRARVFMLKDGGRLHVSAGRHFDQLHFSTGVAQSLRDHRPYYREGVAPKTSINVSATEKAKQIVADIRRRRLPGYERETAACMASKARHDMFNAKRLQALSTAAAPFSALVTCDERSGDPRAVSVECDGLFNLTATPCCEAVKLEIEIGPELAGKMQPCWLRFEYDGPYFPLFCRFKPVGKRLSVVTLRTRANLNSSSSVTQRSCASIWETVALLMSKPSN